MPDQDQSTPPPVPPVPPSAADAAALLQQAARQELMRAAGKLSAVRSDLWSLHVALEISDAEETAIEEGEQPESLVFAMRGAIECVNRDGLDGAIRTLEETALLSQTTLDNEWKEERERQRAARGNDGQ